VVHADRTLAPGSIADAFGPGAIEEALAEKRC
jgi:hypothetical protein